MKYYTDVIGLSSAFYGAMFLLFSIWKGIGPFKKRLFPLGLGIIHIVNICFCITVSTSDDRN